MMKPFHRNLLLAATGLCIVGGGVAVSQVQPLAPVEWDNRRLDTLDRNVRRLERAVTQRNAVGQPVLVEPDPEVVALQGQVGEMDRRLQDLEASLQRLTRDGEQTAFKLDEATRDNAALRTRLNASDARIKAIEDQAQAAAAAVAEAEQAGRSPTGNAAGDLAAARALTDAAEQGQAYEVLIANWPSTPQSAEAGYRLGDLRRAADDMNGAVQAYAGALSGWPTTPWAGETTLKLARALSATNRNPQACAALGEFNRRYTAAASAQLKTIAGQIRTQARCT
ncbi:tol-pal system YbgF family protein [Brevundimonas goettingensis]|uniref:Tol-pal system protein n=1 Tax=Brevundimonas goettingensis TaxID=2774190 RepID=A0A975GYA6_9CAUL|nr:tol-pal system protein [Brevundimonas goettingensis]QTC91390.1 tol-pal system protein [Brevundimonas goettingensis]